MSTTPTVDMRSKWSQESIAKASKWYVTAWDKVSRCRARKERWWQRQLLIQEANEAKERTAKASKWYVTAWEKVSRCKARKEQWWRHQLLIQEANEAKERTALQNVKQGKNDVIDNTNCWYKKQRKNRKGFKMICNCLRKS